MHKFWNNYGNPIALCIERSLRRKEFIRVVDRKTGIHCCCTLDSYRMFGECWHDRDYDVPHFSVGSGDTVLDIGANQGFYSLYAAHKGARTYAFEPDPTSFKTLKTNIESNSMSHLITAYPLAIGKIRGQTELFVSPMLGGGMNSTSNQFAAVALKDLVSETISVNVITLPEAFEELNVDRVRLCKIDCEGSELDILSTVTPELARRVDAFVVEYHPQAYDPADLVKLMASWGTHHISFAEDKYCVRTILRAVSLDQLLIGG